jgi:hypothetical protein
MSISSLVTLVCHHLLLFHGYTHPSAPNLAHFNFIFPTLANRWQQLSEESAFSYCYCSVTNIRIWSQPFLPIQFCRFFPRLHITHVFYLMLFRLYINSSFNLVVSKLLEVIKMLSRYNRLSSFCQAFSLKFYPSQIYAIICLTFISEVVQYQGGIELSESYVTPWQWTDIQRESLPALCGEARALKV